MQFSDGRMLRLLDEVRARLEVLIDLPGWHSLDVNYSEPRVERLWRQYGDDRVYLHVLHPPDEHRVSMLYHPHPWPSAIHLLSGRCEMSVGCANQGDPDFPPDECVRLVLSAGSEYEMPLRRAWHAVRPLEACWSLMVTGSPWRVSPRAPRSDVPPTGTPPMGPLPDHRVAQILSEFRTLARADVAGY